MTPTRHKWKPLGGKPVVGEMERKQCTRCRLQVRRVRRSGTEPRTGFIEVWFRVGSAGGWTREWWKNPLPACVARKPCPTCNGKGWCES